MTDEELIARLRDGCNLQQKDGERAANRIEALVKEKDQEYKDNIVRMAGQAEDFMEEISTLKARIEAMIAERDHWSDVAGREGVCMTCRGPNGAPEPYGCTDCLNTGYCGEHHNTVADLEGKLAKAVEALELCPPDKPQLTDAEFRAAVNTWWKLYAHATLADIKSHSKKTITEWPLEEGNIMVGEMK